MFRLRASALITYFVMLPRTSILANVASITVRTAGTQITKVAINFVLTTCFYNLVFYLVLLSLPLTLALTTLSVVCMQKTPPRSPIL